LNERSDLFLLLLSFALSFVFALIYIPILKHKRVGQTILKYVDMHADKGGTPTVGGVIFIFPLVILSVFILNRQTPLAIITAVSSLGYASLGLLDDCLKIRGGKNMGLRPYQKIIGQGGIALLVSYFFMTANPEGRIFLPFFNEYINIGTAGIFMLSLFVLVATTNAVNLTDGLDGLAGSVSAVYFIFLYILINIMGAAVEISAFGGIMATTVGGLAAFLLFNTKKASVFMGDTGSLFLGSMIAAISLFSYMGFVIVLLGAVFVWSAVTVIIQVAYFKITRGKRVFLMTPYHHHLEKRGLTEPKIVMIYVTVTAVMGVILTISLI
jgi:phospho-N-acetylmuramoyl-pentapeptide-transferase